MSDLMVAIETFTCNDAGGTPVVVHAGTTLLFDDDELVVRYPQFFKVSERHQRPEVEQATSAPAEQRGATARASASGRTK